MKKLITIIAVLVMSFTNAQIAKYKASDYNLTSDVTKYETQEFYFDAAQNKYQMCSKKTIYLNKGLVTKIENVMNYFIYVESTNTFNYKNGQLESIETLSSGNFSTEKFIYKNGKIVERIKDGDSNSRSAYEYDNKGNLSKEMLYEDGALVGKIAYSNYTAPGTYYKKNNKCYNETEQGTDEEWFKNGFMIREKLISEYYQGESSYTYDKLGNQVSQTSEGKTWTNNYVYDAKGNVLKSRVIQQGFDGMPDTNYFTFAKVTYVNGKTEGSIDFDVNYVKKYEPKSSSYEVSYTFNEVTGEELDKALNDLKALTTSTYKIKKNEGNTFTIKDANGEEITNDVEAVKSKNDILVYDILFKKSVLLKNFYNDEVKIGEWYSMEELPSPTGLYWIFSEAPEFFVIQNGVLLDMSLYKLVKTQKEDDFIVQEAGIDKYIIRDLNSKGFETFYPLEFLNNYMRLGVVFSLFFAFGFAQEKHLTSDFRLSKDVTKYESVEYKYNAAIKNFEVSETEILEFQEGKLIQKTHEENSAFAAVMNRVEKYIYNEKGQLLKIEAEGRYPKQFFYDKSGKLVKIFMDRNTEASISEDFTYDKKGNLIKWVKKTGNAIDEERTFFNYINPKSYKYNLKYYQSQKNELLFSEEGEYKSGNKIAYKHISAKDSKETFYNLEYDVYGNLIKSSSNANYLYETVYAYDEKGNVIKERSNDAADLYSKFSKITFKDGTTSGSTTFAPYFTKGIQQPILLMPMNKNPKEKYKVMKTGPTHYEVKNSKGQIVPINPKESLIFEQKDMFFYDAKTNETVVLFGLFTNAYKSNEWYETVTYNSPTGKYIVVNTDWNFFILEKGNVVESSQYKLHKGIDGNTLVIAENGKEKFFVPHLDQMQALVIYPLELISK